MDSVEVLQSQVRQQKENVRVWREGLEREEAKLLVMKQALTHATNVLNSQEVTSNDGAE